jgi:hypothetical protein
MGFFRHLVIGCGVVFAAFGLVGPQTARADVISDWYEVADTAVLRATRTGPVRTPVTVHARSQVALAMFEAANAIERRYESYFEPRAAASPTASTEAAAAVAAHRVLTTLFPDQGGTFNEALALALDRVPDGPSEDQGMAAGAEAADRVLARGEIRPDVTVTPYQPPTPPGLWTPSVRPVFDSWELAVRPWFLDRADAVRPGPPPALTSARYARDLAEVQRLGSVDSRERQPSQTSSVMIWQSMNMSPTFRQVAALPGRTLLDNARFYALMSMAADDAYLAVTDAKLHYSFWRPIAAIRNAHLDGNEATIPDPDWSPLRTTPLHPEYPCAHCIVSAAYATVAAAEPNARVPEGLVFFDPEIPGVVFILDDFDQYAEQTSLSRIYGGVHYRFSNEAANLMGRRIGELAVGQFLRALPREPAPSGAASASAGSRGGG